MTLPAVAAEARDHLPARQAQPVIGTGYPRRTSIYASGVVKRLVDIDDDLLDSARRAAGTQTIRATVEAGLRRLIETDLTLRHVRRLRGRGLEPDALSAARASCAPLDD